MTAAELRMILGDGPAALVCATTPPSRQVWVGADLHTIDADQAMTFPTPRGTELRLGLHKPEPVIHYDMAPNIEAFVAGMRRLQESMQRSGFSFSVGGRR